EQRSQDAGFGGRGQVAQPAATDATATESYKGMKAGADLVVNTGTFTINSADDAVHSNGNAAINGGVFEVATGDDGVHADGDLTVHADITISTCYEGLEGGNVTIDGGNIGIASSDDGLNAAGGSDETTQGMFGQDRFSGGGNNTITINDGTINMLCGGDGVDSNGDFNMAGGRVVMLISSSPDNGGVDCDGTFTATGGAIVYGGTGTGSNPGGNSTQSYVYFNNGVAAGTEVTLRRDGQTILSFTPAIDCQHIAISSPDIVSGNTHSLYSGSSEVASATAGTGGGDMMGRGGMPGGGMPGGKPQN
ncbi:MAG TPA: dockerin type 1, partial [Clostridiales bacterium]|nr:dockerin type 1 [Clostridiales bacterium]